MTVHGEDEEKAIEAEAMRNRIHAARLTLVIPKPEPKASKPPKPPKAERKVKSGVMPATMRRYLNQRLGTFIVTNIERAEGTTWFVIACDCGRSTRIRLSAAKSQWCCGVECPLIKRNPKRNQ